MNDATQPTQVVITQDKLVDLLMHAATREDIAALRQETNTKFEKIELSIERLDQKIDSNYVKLDQKIDSSIAKIDQKLDSSLAEFKRSMEAMEARMDRQFHKMDGRNNWIIGTVLACFITLTGLMGHWLHAF